MKKFIVLSMVFALSFAVVMPVMAVTVGVSLSPDTTGGTAPVVQAKWESNTDRYSDDDPIANAQFMPTGVKDQNRTISICAIVSDPDGLSDVNHVYADVFYPTGIAVGSSHVKLPSQTGSVGAGCGVLMQEDELTSLTKADGIDLFCNSVKNLNNNLPKFKTGASYTTLCAADGMLQKEMAKVYCVTKDLSYEDPAGSYKVEAVVVDKAGKSGTLFNNFDYMALTAFETDFTSIAYGKVRLETEKIINGDLSWGPALATVRNVGNTRLAITVNQDDMNFGKTGMLWNVAYKARIGNNELDWTSYDPNITTTLKDSLDLSEMDEIDFAIFAKKFPVTEQDYTGSMTLGATLVDPIPCSST